MEYLKKNVMKVASSPKRYFPMLLKNLDVVVYALAVFIILLPYVVFKKITGDF